MDLAAKVRDIPDFPKKGILFKDITTLLKDGAALKEAIDRMASPYEGTRIDAVVGCESRGFIFGTAVAYKLGVGFIPVRKPGKLPAKTEKVTYELEYGTDTLEIHADAINKGDNILIVDDLLATGGTASGTAHLVEKLGGRIVGISFLIELTFIPGREKIKNYPVTSIIKY